MAESKKVENGSRTEGSRTNMILTIALIVLVVISAIQLFQFSAIKSKIASTGSLSLPVAAGSSGSGNPGMSGDLPEMVGGC